MTLATTVLVALAVTATFSRMLTVVTLFQRKEWRWDRLREHFATEGMASQVYGRIEPLFILIAFIGYIEFPSIRILYAYVIALNVLGFLKTVKGKQPTPVWTQKAMLISLLTITEIAAITYGLASYFDLLIGLTILPLLVPFIVQANMLITTPLDKLLKFRIIHTAKKLRSSRQNLTVIGITGSVGKTTTKELLAHLFADKKPLATPAHVNTEMGVAAWLMMELPKNQDASLLIVEMGAYRIGEIKLLCEITQPQYGIITLIGDAHLGLFGSREAIAKAKSELFVSLPQNGRAFTNADTPMINVLRDACACPVTTISTGGTADIVALDIEEVPQGIHFTAQGVQYMVPLHGAHNVSNVLLAIAVAQALGMKPEVIRERLKTFTPPNQTFTVEERNGVTLLNDTYNCSPESFKAAIAWTKLQPHARKILVTSGIIELGDSGNNIHTDIGAMAKGIFTETYFANSTYRDAFARGFGVMPQLIADERPKIAAGDLLVCVGRLPSSLIDTLVTL